MVVVVLSYQGTYYHQRMEPAMGYDHIYRFHSLVGRAADYSYAMAQAHAVLLSSFKRQIQHVPVPLPLPLLWHTI